MPLVKPLILGDPQESIDGPQLLLSAFAHRIQQNLKQQQLEYQLKRMAEQARQSEEKLALEDRWHTISDQTARDRIATTEERLGLERDRNDFQREKWGKDSGRLSEFQKRLSDIPDARGSQAWQDKANLIQSEYADLMANQTGQKIWSQAMLDHRTTASQSAKATAQVAKDYLQNLNRKKISDAWLSDGVEWGTNKDGSRFIAYDATTFQRLPDKTGSATPGAVFKTLSASEYETLLKQKRRLEEAGSSDAELPAADPTVGKPKQVKQNGVVYTLQPDGSYQ